MTARPVDHTALAIVGYTDRISALPGESLSVHASSTHTKGSLRLVRLGHDGKTFTKEPVTTSAAIELAHRDTSLESYGLVDAIDLPAAPLALSTWVWMTRRPPGPEQATLLAVEGLALAVDSAGKVAFRAGDHEVKTSTALPLRRWCQVTGGLEADGRPFVIVQPQRSRWVEPQPERVVGDRPAPWNARTSALTIGRGLDAKLEDVALGRTAADASDDILRLDMARGISTWTLHDTSGAPVGRLVGLPARAVKGRRWDGSTYDWRSAPDHYAAVHFHTDDQGDQRWPTTATVKLPEDLQSGLYAIELSAGDAIDHLPIVVRPGPSKRAPLLLVLPSMTYLAYALEHATDASLQRVGWPIKRPEAAAQFGRANNYHSLYDVHLDASPIVLSSLRRPLLGMRPDHFLRFAGCEHGLSADLHLIGWLARQGFAFDLATDHDLDVQGADLLEPYRGVLTGGHPEYMSGRLFDALEDYLARGGNLAYLGGNGFCWTTALDPNDPSVLELRRGARRMRWEGDAGEDNLQFTGQPAGLWNSCGRMAAEVVGVNWATTGMQTGAPFQRTAASFDSRVAHLFADIGDDELIGEHGAILGAAASYEVDFANPLMGTPAHALIIATAVMPPSYFPSPFPILEFVGSETKASLLRADMVFFETQAGGAVFSASSVGWNGALSHDQDRNPASRLMVNLLRAFVESPR